MGQLSLACGSANGEESKDFVALALIVKSWLLIVNVFTQNTKHGRQKSESPIEGRRNRGRPRGRTQQGIAARKQLYKTAIKMITSRGYEATTLREIANKAGVSVGLLYRYFPSKRAVVLALYDELSEQFAHRVSRMRSGTWHQRFMFVLRTSLRVLQPHRATIAVLIPLMVSQNEEGLFSPTTTVSRLRVQEAFVSAVRGATDAPEGEAGSALGRLLYILHLVVLLWWVLEKSPKQRATKELVGLLNRVAPLTSLALGFPGALSLVGIIDNLVCEGLFREEQRSAKAAI
jgi:AcrR family transcriptional regulator